jgi:hypothetical protein
VSKKSSVKKTPEKSKNVEFGKAQEDSDQEMNSSNDDANEDANEDGTWLSSLK